MRRLPVFVVSLPQSTERRRPLLAVLTEMDVAHEVFEAADGAKLVSRREVPWSDAATLEPQPLLGRRLTAGEIGCAVSHLTLWRRIAGGQERAVVLEDDCHLAHTFPGVLSGLRAQAWDLVLLGHRSTRRGAEAGATPALGGRPLGRSHRLARLVEFATGSYAYAISPEGAARLARFAEPIRVPADWVTGYAPAAGVRLHGVTPPCAVPDVDAPSTIPAREAEYPAGEARRSPTSAVRGWVGKAWLTARRLGVCPGGYTWPYAAALQPRRGRTTSA
jgi:glycosyl transferase, family 25